VEFAKFHAAKKQEDSSLLMQAIEGIAFPIEKLSIMVRLPFNAKLVNTDGQTIVSNP